MSLGGGSGGGTAATMKDKEKHPPRNGSDQDEAKIHQLFSSVIYETKLRLDTEFIANYCLKTKRATQGVSKTNVGGWESPSLKGDYSPYNFLLLDRYASYVGHRQTSFTVSDCPPLDTLFTAIVEHANILKNTFLFNHPLVLNNAWVSVNNYRDYNFEHSHPHAFISGVYYVQVPVDSGVIKFFHPISEILKRDWDAAERSKFNEYNSEDWTLLPEENKLLLFPSWLRHSVMPNLNKKERVSISFNLR